MIRKLGAMGGWLGLICCGIAAFPTTLSAAPGDTIADRVLGQGNLRSSAPYFVDGRVFGASGIVFDRSATPNRVYVADTELNRVLGWADERGFLRGAPADLVLGQPDLLTGLITYYFDATGCKPPGRASLCGPQSIAVDRDGNVYVADVHNLRVLEFDRPFATDRLADRVFGQPDFSTRLLPGAGAGGGLSQPEVALDPAGDLFILDRGQDAPRLLAYRNPVRTDAQPDLVALGANPDECGYGDPGGGAPAGRLCFPLGLAFDARGDLYVLDRNVYGGGASGQPDGRLLIYRSPFESNLQPDLVVAFDASSLEPQGGLVFNAAGDLLFSGARCFARFAGPLGPGSAPACVVDRGGFGPLARLAVDAFGRLFAPQFYAPGDLLYNMLLKFEPPFAKAATPQVVTAPRRTSSTLRYPRAVAVDRSISPNRLYVLDYYHRVLGWRDAEDFGNGAPADLVIGGRGSRIPESRGVCAEPTATRLCVSYGAGGLAVDRAGNLYVADSGNHRVLQFDRPFDTDVVADRVLGQGSFTSKDCNRNGVSATSLCKPGALALDREDNLYVADLENARILYFRDPLHGDAKADRVLGQPDFRTSYIGTDCPAATARSFCLGETNANHGGIESAADGLAVDRAGNLYVADGGNHRVLVFFDAARSDAVADRVLGQGGSFTSDRPGTSARRFRLPGGIALGPAGELYVADTANSRVLEFDHPLASDEADRVFGQRDFTRGSVPFVLPTPSTLDYPYAVAVDEQGDLFVADTNHGRVVVYDQP